MEQNMYLCKGRRAGRLETLAAAQLGCNGNCLGSHLPNVVPSCCSLHCPSRANVSGSSSVLSVLGKLRQVLEERTIIWPRELQCRRNAGIHWCVFVCCPEESTWSLELVCSQASETNLSTKTWHKHSNHHGSDAQDLYCTSS